MWDFIQNFLAQYLTVANVTSWVRAGLAFIGGGAFLGSADAVTQVAGAAAIVIVAVWSYLVHKPTTPTPPAA